LCLLLGRAAKAREHCNRREEAKLSCHWVDEIGSNYQSSLWASGSSSTVSPRLICTSTSAIFTASASLFVPAIGRSVWASSRPHHCAYVWLGVGESVSHPSGIDVATTAGTLLNRKRNSLLAIRIVGYWHLSSGGSSPYCQSAVEEIEGSDVR
jgi:hypothetical protein